MERLELVKRNVQEIVEEEELALLIEEQKHPKAYVGYAPTGMLHIGHLLPLLKIGDFLKAGFKFTILVADLHAYLDDQKTPWHLLDARSRYYKEVMKACLEDVFKIDTRNLKFVKGSDFQLEAQYMLDVLRMAADVTVARARRAASEVIRFAEEAKLGGLIYPLMQIEDVVALNVDVAFGGIDQRGIYMLAREILPRLNYRKPICIFNPLLPALHGGRMGGKMSASEEKGKINLIEDAESIERKIRNAFCPAKQVQDNPVLMLMRCLIFPLKGKFKVEREPKYGGDKTYNSYEELEKDFVLGNLHPADLKQSLAKEISKMLAPLRKKFSTQKYRKLIEEAYPK